MAEITALPHRDVDTFARAAAELMQGWLTSGRERQPARFAFALEATRRPELRKALVASGARIRAMVADLFAAAGVSEPGRRASDFAAFLDGLLFDQIAGAGARERTSAELDTLIRALLTAVAGRAFLTDGAAGGPAPRGATASGRSAISGRAGRHRPA